MCLLIALILQLFTTRRCEIQRDMIIRALSESVLFAAGIGALVTGSAAATTGNRVVLVLAATRAWRLASAHVLWHAAEDSLATRHPARAIAAIQRATPSSLTDADALVPLLTCVLACDAAHAVRSVTRTLHVKQIETVR